MSSVLRPGTFFSLYGYLAHLSTFLVMAMPRLIVGQWPAFEVFPLLVPLWLSSSVLWNEHNESYAFLRVMPVTDRDLVRAKLGVIFWMSTLYWALVVGATAAWWGEGVAGPAMVVYMTLVWALGLFVAAGWQIGIWRFGASAMTGYILAFMGVNMLAALAHALSLKQGQWGPLSQLAGVRWLAGSPWLAHAAIIALVVVAYWRLMRVGVRVKAASEACL